MEWQYSPNAPSSHRFNYQAIPKHHQNLFQCFYELLTNERISFTSQEKQTFVHLLERLIGCLRVSWAYVDSKTGRSLLLVLLQIIFALDDTTSENLLTRLYRQRAIPWNEIFTDPEGIKQTHLFYLMMHVDYPAVLSTLETLVTVPNLNWGAKTSANGMINLTPLALVLQHFEITQQAIKKLLEHVPLSKLPFHQIIEYSNNRNSQPNTRMHTIECISSLNEECLKNIEAQLFYKNVTSDGKIPLYDGRIAERIKDASIAEQFIERIPAKSKLYS